MSVMLDRHDLSDLFENGRLVSFSEDPREHVPKIGSMIYTVWDKHGRFIYVGICGIQKTETRCHAYSLMRAAGEVVTNFAFMCMTFLSFPICLNRENTSQERDSRSAN